MKTPFNPLNVLIALIGAAAIVLAAGACAETTFERIKRTGEVRIGYANEKPFAYTETDGRVTGESPEIAKHIVKTLGIKKVNAVLVEWGGLIPGLIAGRFDVIAAGMYVTPERMKQVLFSDPHYQIGDALLVAKGNPKGLHSYADFAKGGNSNKPRLAIMSGTAQYAYARAAGVPDSRIMQVPNTTAQLQAVRTGRASAAIGTALTMRSLVAKGGARVALGERFEDDPAHTGYGALAFRQQDADLRDAFNGVLKSWIGTDDHLKTIAPFGFDRTNLTTKTAAEIGQGK
jgi:polar amino acid transport system substrate-binding protein